MAKSKGDRDPITIVCRECSRYQYTTVKNRRNDPERLEVRKYCPSCRAHQAFREKR